MHTQNPASSTRSKMQFILEHLRTLTDVFFAQPRPNKASPVTIGAGWCQLRIAGSWRTLYLLKN